MQTTRHNALLHAAARVRASTLPTRAAGSILPTLTPSPLNPGWSVYETQQTTIPVDALRWPRSRETYENMSRDPQIQGLLMSVFLPIRHMQWYVDPEGTRGSVAEEIAEDFGLPLLTDTQADEDGPGVDHDEHLRLALLALAHGHKIFQEEGVSEGNGPSSKYRLRTLIEEPNDRLDAIYSDSRGNLVSVRMNAADPTSDGPFVDVPADHLLHYCWDKRGADNTGRPLLYGLYRAWLLKDEAVREDATMNRRFAGVPVVETTDRDVTAEALDKAAGMAQAIQSGDGAGAALPYGTRLRILGVEGTLPQPLESAKYQDSQMSRAFMQMVMDLGTSQHGSRALGSTLMDHYALGVLAIAKWAQKTQMTLVRRIVVRNYGPGEALPHIRCRAASNEDFTTGELVSLIDAGAITVDDDLEQQIRERGNLIPRNPTTPARRPPMPSTPARGVQAVPQARMLRAASAHTGVMIALYPPAATADALALTNGETPDALHVTLAFCGEQDDLADPDALHRVVADWAARTPAFIGRVSGAGLFTEGPDAPVTYLSIDLPALPDARQLLIDSLVEAGIAPSMTFGFTPHMTVSYTDRITDAAARGGTPLAFASVAAVIGGAREDYRLGDGETIDVAAAGPVIPAIVTETFKAAAGSIAARSRTNFAALQAAHLAAVEHLRVLWAGIRGTQINSLADQIARATDTSALSGIAAPVEGAHVLTGVLDAVLQHAAEHVIEEAEAQGHTLDHVDLIDADRTIEGAAQAVAGLLADSLTLSAKSKATQLAGATTPMTDVAAGVADYLHGLAGAAADYELDGLATRAQNEGRFAALAHTPTTTRYYASALIELTDGTDDPACCQPCRDENDTEFDTLAEARRDFPTGGFIGCLGMQRCRCTIVAVLDETPGQASDEVHAATRHHGFRSKAQWRYFFANPRLRAKYAHKMAHETPGGAKVRYRRLPERVGAPTIRTAR